MCTSSSSTEHLGELAEERTWQVLWWQEKCGAGAGRLGFDSTFIAWCQLRPIDFLRWCALIYEMVIIILLVRICNKYPQISSRSAV